MINIIKESKREMERLGLVEIPFLTERLCTSVACHYANLANLDETKFYNAGVPEDLRLQVTLMAASGWGKTVFYDLFLDKDIGFLNKTKIPTSVQSTFSRESWMGTITSTNGGEVEKSEGLFEKYKRGIIGADEFSILKTLMECDNEDRNDLTYLLTALSKRKAVKNLAYGSIPIDGIGTTLWAGLRIVSIMMRSGLARRFSFHLFFPTPALAKKFSEANVYHNQSPSEDFQQMYSEFLTDAYEKVKSVSHIDTSAIKDTYGFVDEEEFKVGSKRMTPHFEESILRRISIGYALAEGQSSFPRIKLSEGLKALCENERKNRFIIRHNPEAESVYEVIKSCGEEGIDRGYMYSFMSYYYQLNKYRIKVLLQDLIYAGRVLLDDKTNKYFIKEKEEKK